MIFRFCLVLTGFLVLTGGAFADAIDDYIESRRTKDSIPAISVGILKDGKLIKQKGYGLADVELNAPASEISVYQLGSITKIFTAEAIMLLQQEGKLKLDEKLSMHYAKTPPAWSNITVRHLLSHTSGIKNLTSLPEFRRRLREDYQPEEFMDQVKDLPLEFEPGSKWNYCNTGYLLLGVIIEKLSGQTYATYVKEKIFYKVGMPEIRHNDQFEIIPNRVTGYRMASNGLVRAEFVSPTQPAAAGALVGTIKDLLTYDRSLTTDSLLPSLLPLSIRKEMWTPVVTSNGRTNEYGLGWQIMEHRGRKIIGHGGSIDGFNTFYMRMPEDKLTVVVLLNTSADPYAIALGIAGHSLPDFTLASMKPRPDTDPAFTAKVKATLLQLASTKDAEEITPELRRNFANSKRRFGALKQDMEAMSNFSFIISEPPPRGQTRALNVPVAKMNAYKVETPKGSTYYRVAITEEGKIAAFEAE